MDIQPNIEFESPETIEQYNFQLLKHHIDYCAEHSPFYRRLFQANNISPEDISSIEDLILVPLTRKSDLEEYNRDFLAVAEREIVDTCRTSGTTGRPIDILLTMEDCMRLGYNEKISLTAAGVTPDDSVMIACALGRSFMAGMAYYEGVRSIGARAIRIGSGSITFLADAVVDNRPDVIICVPSQALQIAEYLSKEGQTAADYGVRLIVCIGEPIRNADLTLSRLGEKLVEHWKCDLAGTYASTEMATSFTECAYGIGGHFHPELITIEILDENGRQVGPGCQGEIVVTPLQVKGMPLLRYCTGDIAEYHPEKCKCGRRSYRLGPVICRKDQMMKIRGTTVYPAAIATVLQGIPAVKNYYLEVSGVYELSENIKVVVGADDFSDDFSKYVSEKLRSYIRIKPEVEVKKTAEVHAKNYPENKRKAVTFFDYRSKDSSVQNKKVHSFGK